MLEMTAEGLRDVADPARAFLGEGARAAPGRGRRGQLEGSRPLLVEVQALVAPAGIGVPRRTVAGIDAEPARVAGGRARPAGGHHIGGQDIYVSLAGGATRRRARARPAAGAGPRLVAARPAVRAGHGRLRRGVAARRAASGPGPRTAAARGGTARDSAQAIVPAGDDATRLGPASSDRLGAAPDRRGRHASRGAWPPWMGPFRYHLARGRRSAAGTVRGRCCASCGCSAVPSALILAIALPAYDARRAAFSSTGSKAATCCCSPGRRLDVLGYAVLPLHHGRAGALSSRGVTTCRPASSWPPSSA